MAVVTSEHQHQHSPHPHQHFSPHSHPHLKQQQQQLQAPNPQRPQMMQSSSPSLRDHQHHSFHPHGDVHGLRLALGSILSPKRLSTPSSRTSSGTASPCPAHFGPGLIHSHSYQQQQQQQQQSTTPTSQLSQLHTPTDSPNQNESELPHPVHHHSHSHSQSQSHSTSPLATTAVEHGGRNVYDQLQHHQDPDQLHERGHIFKSDALSRENSSPFIPGSGDSTVSKRNESDVVIRTRSGSVSGTSSPDSVPPAPVSVPVILTTSNVHGLTASQTESEIVKRHAQRGVSGSGAGALSESDAFKVKQIQAQAVQVAQGGGGAGGVNAYIETLKSKRAFDALVHGNML